MLGIIFGVAAVIAMVSLGNGARAQLEASIASLGQNVVTVMSGTMSRGGFRGGFGSSGTLTVDDYESIRKEVSGVNGASPDVRTSRNWRRATRISIPRSWASGRTISKSVPGSAS